MEEGPASRLREAISSEGGNVREIARRLAGVKASSGDVERWRRAVYRCLSGQAVRQPIAERFAEVFGKPRDYFMTTRAGGVRRGEAVDEELKDLRESLQALEGTVANLAKTVAAQGRQLRELAAPRTRKVAGTAREAPKR